jgi:hypothetical protein
MVTRDAEEHHFLRSSKQRTDSFAPFGDLSLVSGAVRPWQRQCPDRNQVKWPAGGLKPNKPIG